MEADTHQTDEQESSTDNAPQQEKSILQKTRKKDSKIYSGLFLMCIAIVSSVIIWFVGATLPPKNFPTQSVVVFEKDEYVSTLTRELKEKRYIKSPTLFKAFLKLSGKEGKIKAGSYYFEAPINVSQIAYRFSAGDFNQTRIKITIPEGSTNREIIRIVAEKYPSFDTKKLVSLLDGSEGKLFPETYFFETTSTEEEVVDRMKREYVERVLPTLSAASITSEKDIQKITILASLVEEEGKTVTDKQKITAILLKRLAIGMPLQVDATINYIKGQNTRVYYNELEIDSPYNTYRNKGLPPGPISNPGIESYKAVLSPIDEGYLYYLTGRDGVFYYAKTFDEHVINKQRYLR